MLFTILKLQVNKNQTYVSNNISHYTKVRSESTIHESVADIVDLSGIFCQTIEWFECKKNNFLIPTDNLMTELNQVVKNILLLTVNAFVNLIIHINYIVTALEQKIDQ